MEVVLDLGRRPEARFPDGEVTLLDREIGETDIAHVVEHIGTFGDDNRAGIERTLHRISAIRNRNGKIVGLIVGVGGFLGIGEKSVAIDMSAFQPVPADTGSSTGAGGNTTVASRNDDPTMVKLKVSWTKDQLKNAPDFQYYKPPARTTSGAGGSPTTGMAPRPTAPPPAGR